MKNRIIICPKTNFTFFCQFVLLILLLAVQGCAYSAYSVYDDERMLDTIRDDKAMATSIKAALMQAHFGASFSVSVYCFYGNVFLVGEASPKVQARAIEIARSFHPVSITPHWFSPEKNERSNLVIAADLRASLIAQKGLSSTHIDAEVHAGRVVLLGVVSNDGEKQLAIQTARKIKGVTSVTSYLMLPQKPMQPTAHSS